MGRVAGTPNGRECIIFAEAVPTINDILLQKLYLLAVIIYHKIT